MEAPEGPAMSPAYDESPEALTTLCTRQIFRYADFDELDHILGTCCPPGIFPDLMRTVLLGGDDDLRRQEPPPPRPGPPRRPRSPPCSPIAVRIVLKHWPDDTFRMSEIGIRSSRNPADDSRKGSSGVSFTPKCEQDCVTAVLRAFLDALGHVPCSKLRVLDLRGFELGDMDFLKNYKSLFLDPYLEKTGCQIFLDLNITYANDYLLWNEILPRVQGVIKVAKLSTIFRTGFDSTKLILDALDAQVLTSLVAKHLEMINEEFVLLVDSMSRLSALTELDLSCGMLRLSEARTVDEQNSKAVEGLAHILQCLPRLTRLNLSNNKLGANVGTFFGKAEFGLESLSLKNCGLLPCDIEFMSRRGCDRIFSSLESLNVGDNNVAEDILMFIGLLEKLKKLRTLCLEECCLKESHARPICEVVRCHLRQLRDLNLAGHKWGKATLIDCVHCLVPRPELISLVLPIYGIGSLQFKFKVARWEGSTHRPPLNQVLEPVAGQCSEVEEIRKTVESYKDKRNGFKSMGFSINWLDGMSFTFKKH